MFCYWSVKETTITSVKEKGSRWKRLNTLFATILCWNETEYEKIVRNIFPLRGNKRNAYTSLMCLAIIIYFLNLYRVLERKHERSFSFFYAQRRGNRETWRKGENEILYLKETVLNINVSYGIPRCTHECVFYVMLCNVYII